ncbi:hypothetical protein M436DRAFT_62945 [Aureobasidium namibiae CBS 147.97]|uniref:Uncharacterized protein n=1 Tax=Aureobasidium namibiae CBS 147.97 TaxID=1043004 RepID=A0A074WN56_9PEZI|nr:uncharacterized protein M436DRAFT_62945 [Aureobasidium namibiae CBS 147.97]KEQ74568.1 hypothetical protein M436DRAFT_62945 [Aureobasidium namibiae CBS 147.97]
MPESEGPEEQSYAPVALINSVIIPSPDTSCLPGKLASTVPGKLKRPSLNQSHRGTTLVPRGDVFAIDALPGPNLQSSSSLPRREPSRRSKRIASPRRQQRQIRTASRLNGFDTDASSNRVVESHSTMNRAHPKDRPQEPSRKRQKLESTPVTRHQLHRSAPTMHMSDQEREESSAPTSTRGKRTTRSTKEPELLAFDLTRRRQVVEVVIDNAASIQRLSHNAHTGNQPPSRPAVVQNPKPTVKFPVLSTSVLHDQDYTDSTQEAGSKNSPSNEANDVQSIVVEQGPEPPREDSALFASNTPPARDARAQAELRSQDIRRAHELYDTDGLRLMSESPIAQTEDFRYEADSSKDVLMPEQLNRALENAHDIHRDAEDESLCKEFDGVRILKDYDSLKSIIGQWRTAQDYGQTDELIQLSNHITKEAKAILTKPGWDRRKGLSYIHTRVLPTLVRTLYISLAYYLAEVNTMKRMSYEQLNASKSVVKAIVHLVNRVKYARPTYHRSQDVISMVARIKETAEIFDRLLRAYRQQKAVADSAQWQQTQELRQEVCDREEAFELELREWRQRWRVLHDQRLGAEMEGRTLLNREQGHHLRHIPLDNPHVLPPYWDAEAHVAFLVDGLQRFAGPNVYREIFREYCVYSGPLRAFNVAEIIDKAVSLKQQLVKLAEEDEEEVDQWVNAIFDPRVPPEGLRRGGHHFQG